MGGTEAFYPGGSPRLTVSIKLRARADRINLGRHGLQDGANDQNAEKIDATGELVCAQSECVSTARQAVIRNARRFELDSA
jgi:hypothetical protein